MTGTAYLEILPEEDLKPFIKCFWLSANESGAELHVTTLPDGCLELVAIYRDQRLHELLLSGILCDAYDMTMLSGEIKMGIRILPLGKEYFLDRCEDLDRFRTLITVASRDFFVDLQNFAQRLSADIRDIIPRSIDSRKLTLFNLLEQTQGNIDVKTLSQQSFWPSRQINRYFNKELGISLKSYSNILKCYASYCEIKAGNLNPDLGHYDQSHFIREIKKYTGTTPKVLMRNESQRYLQLNEVMDAGAGSPKT